MDFPYANKNRPTMELQCFFEQYYGDISTIINNIIRILIILVCTWHGSLFSLMIILLGKITKCNGSTMFIIFTDTFLLQPLL